MTRAGGGITTDDGDDPAARTAVPAQPSPACPSRPTQPRRRPRLRFAFRPLILVMCGGLMMLGSRRPWITATYAQHNLTMDGIHRAISAAYGVNGSATFAAGAVLGGTGLVLAAWRAGLLKLIAFLAAFAGLGVAVYVMIRILHDMSQAHSDAAGSTSLSAQVLARASLGYGLILVLGAAFVGLLVVLTDIEAR